jgi:hypothetical protein
MARYDGDDAVCFYCGGRQFASAGSLRKHLLSQHPVLDEHGEPIPGEHYGPDFEQDAQGYWRQKRPSS